MAKTPSARVVNLVSSIRSTLGRLQQKMAPPSVAVLDLVTGMWSFQIVYALCELGIPDQLTHQPISGAAIARAVGAPEDRVYRLLRAAATIGLVIETGERAFRATSIGETLRQHRVGSVRDFILFQGRHGWENWGALTDCIRTGKSAVMLRHGKNAFDYFTSPGISDTFNRAMTGISFMTEDAILAAYPFGRFPTVADIGGGHGRLLGAILRAHSAHHGILVDLPSVISGAAAVLDELGVSDRCQMVEADFFQPLPEMDVDLFVMKAIIHDWLDPEANTILRHVRARMRPESRLILCEVVVPGPNRPSLAKHLDMEMMVHADGKERTREEYAELCRRSGLRLRQITPSASPISLIEAAPI